MKKITVLLLSLAGFIAGTTSALAAPDVGSDQRAHTLDQQPSTDAGEQLGHRNNSNTTDVEGTPAAR